MQELHCPTCGEPYELPLTARYDAPAPYALDTRSITAAPGRPFVECPRGHRWTIAVVFRVDDRWDEILLGDYIGGGS